MGRLLCFLEPLPIAAPRGSWSISAANSMPPFWCQLARGLISLLHPWRNSADACPPQGLCSHRSSLTRLLPLYRAAGLKQHPPSLSVLLRRPIYSLDGMCSPDHCLLCSLPECEELEENWKPSRPVGPCLRLARSEAAQLGKTSQTGDPRSSLVSYRFPSLVKFLIFSIM